MCSVPVWPIARRNHTLDPVRRLRDVLWSLEELPSFCDSRFHSPSLSPSCIKVHSNVPCVLVNFR